MIEKLLPISNVDAVDQEGNTAPVLAVEQANMETTNFLIERKKKM